MAVASNTLKVTRYFFHKICNGLLRFKGLLLTAKVTAPRLKAIKINGNVQQLKKKICLFWINELINVRKLLPF